MRLACTLLWVLAVLAVAACNEVFEEVPTAPLNLTFTSWEPPPRDHDSVPWESIRVCELDTDNCERTDANGEATLMLPVGPETGYTTEWEGAPLTLIPFVMPIHRDSYVANQATPQYNADMHSRVGSPYPMRGTGTVFVVFQPVGLAGATLELDAATGVPFYSDEEWNWNPDLTATTLLGRGGFTEVTPGEVQVNVGGTAGRCVPFFFGWPGRAENSVRLPVREGYVTVVNVGCATP